MIELSTVLRSYSLSVNRPNTGDKRVSLVNSLHAHYNELNQCVQSRLNSTIISFRGKGFTLTEFADFFRTPPIVLLAIYDTYGTDIDLLMHYCGREVILHKGRNADKIELGNRYFIPWQLVDKNKEDYVLYDELIRLYTAPDRMRGDIGNPKVASGSDSFTTTLKNIRDYERILSNALQNLNRNTDKPARRRATVGNMSASEAKRGTV